MKATFDTPVSSSHSAWRPTQSDNAVVDVSIGHVLSRAHKLDAAKIPQVLQHQNEHGLRFGEAAMALGLISRDDVLWALSQQFHYPYVPGQEDSLDPELVAAADPFSDEAEAFRGMRSQLMLDLARPDHPPRALAVLSPDVGDGKSYFASNIAITFSQLGGRTLLVDADMRTPRLHDLFGLGGRPGLSSVLSGRCEASVVRPIQGLPSLHVLPVGTLPPNPLELVQRPAFGLLMRELLAKFDHVVVDTPAATHGADARVLAAKCGVAIVIGRRRTTRMRSLQQMLHDLAKTGTQMAGVMVNEY